MKKNPTILMIDDDPMFLKGYKSALQNNYSIFIAETVKTGLEIIQAEQPDILLLDIALNREKEGIEILPMLKKEYPDLQVIMVTNYDSYTLAEEAMDEGAAGIFIKRKPIRLLIPKLENILLAKKNTEQNLKSLSDIDLVSTEIRAVYLQAKKVAINDYAVHITGETGVGKEILARYIHENSNRKLAPFVVVNCPAIPETLFESELFGYTKGAFTGANEDTNGLLVQADKGTLFLDEIGELSLSKQSKLLRVLQDQQVMPIGSRKAIKVDFRIISATNMDLKQAIKEKAFRDDLYFRIADYEIEIPPIRKRSADILPLFRYFLDAACKTEGLPLKNFTDQALWVLTCYDWPGNIRDIQRISKRLFTDHRNKKEICSVDLAIPKPAMADIGIYTIAKTGVLKKFQNDILKKALVLHEGNISLAAKEIGITRQQFHKLLKENGLDTR